MEDSDAEPQAGSEASDAVAAPLAFSCRRAVDENAAGQGVHTRHVCGPAGTAPVAAHATVVLFRVRDAGQDACIVRSVPTM